jgi:hypothetical protein
MTRYRGSLAEEIANTSVFKFLPSFAVRDTAHVVASIAANLTTINENRARSNTTTVGSPR